MKRFLRYLAWTVFIGVIFYLGTKFQVSLEKEAAITFDSMPGLLFTTVFMIVMGMLLRLPKLISEIKEHKRWTFDWIKIVAIGLPALYIAILPLMTLTSLGTDLLFANAVVTSGQLVKIAGIIFGYVLLDSLKKNVVQQTGMILHKNLI
ncbi:hypothetical protein [Paenisporosarcina sp. TG20]|uniref:hypothetical protein n=1 Tax=Paenisporosarcina sp. TG20 TaxID=1211706 RepID=UPI0002DEED1E|nr:hypothetical protein [Paenisporosarcina sp. TG20]